MTTIRHRLADIAITYRTHVLELPESCPECGDAVEGSLREENWSTSAFDVELADGELHTEDEHCDPSDFHPSGVYCRCGYAYAVGEVSQLDLD